MKKNIFYIMLFIQQSLYAQGNNRITGFLGLYHTTAGYIYLDSLGLDSIPTQALFRFGEMAIPSQLVDNGFEFRNDIDSCNNWQPNRILGMIQPPSEGGTYNQPDDTSLLYPFDISLKPGMIQAGARFSRLSQQYGPYCGVILDDWDADTSITHRIRDAVRGKPVDRDGNVDYAGVATTPYNKLFAVVYYPWIDPSALNVVDGVSYWYVDSQNCCYAKLDNDIDQIRFNIPKKEILIGIYLKNSHIGWTNPDGVTYLLSHAINRYDDGDINGITLFCGPYLTKQSMPLSQWNAFRLTKVLDSLYYPFLGEGTGRVTDCINGEEMGNAFVRIHCKGRVSGDWMMRSRQKTDSRGSYQFGAWAGNRNTDSTFYWVIADKAGYNSDSVGFWIKRNEQTRFPDLQLCRSVEVTSDEIQLFPNPADNQIQINGRLCLRAELYIKNIVGVTVLQQTLEAEQNHIDLHSLKPGYYIIQVDGEGRGSKMKRLIKQ